MAILSGIVIDRYMDQRVRCFLALVVGTAICYGFGTAWLAYQAHMTFAAALAAGVIPFIIGDLIKIVLAVVIGLIKSCVLMLAGLVISVALVVSAIKALSFVSYSVKFVVTTFT